MKRLKLPWIRSVLTGALLLIVAGRVGAQTNTSASPPGLGPILTFATNQYNFGRVTAGTLVKYDFIVTNTGDQALEITAVAPGCHCTTAGDWTHHIEPGQTGRIPIRFDSGNFRSEVTKTIMVTSNDKHAPRQNILLHGTVWRQLDVSPQVAYINVLPDAPSNATCTVRIISHTEEPVTLSEPTGINAYFKSELRVVNPGKVFDLIITAVPPLPSGNTVGRISLKTSLTNTPELDITTFAMVQPTVAVIPPQMVLPPQISGWMTNTITINNHRTAPLTLSDPQVCCDPRASAQLRTIIAGRSFQLEVAIPPNYQITAGQAAQVTVKSDNAAQPVITVPIRVFSFPLPFPKPTLAHSFPSVTNRP